MCLQIENAQVPLPRLVLQKSVNQDDRQRGTPTTIVLSRTSISQPCFYKAIKRTRKSEAVLQAEVRTPRRYLSVMFHEYLDHPIERMESASKPDQRHWAVPILDAGRSRCSRTIL